MDDVTMAAQIERASLAAIPRRVWFHWAQGLDAAPPIVKRCLKNWIDVNPEWEVVFLDRDNLARWIDPAELPLEALRATSEQVYANAVRLALLRRHGGVWVDATCWSRRPLSTWLTERPGGFFAFSDPGSDRPMANWFMAALPNNYLVHVLEHEYVRIFRQYGHLKPFSGAMVKELMQRTGGTDVFLDPFLLGRLRGYPYYLFHYLFEALCKKDQAFAGHWQAQQKLSARPALEPGNVGLEKQLDEEMRRRWLEADAPIYKLSWRLGKVPRNSILAAILSGEI